jgi:hypothetical protein
VKSRILLRKDGTIAWLDEPPFTLPGRKFRKRFSEITPIRIDLFIAFRILRLLFGEQGKVAAWTRKWKCEWRMRIISSGYTETGWDRAKLIEREKEIFFYPLGEL